MSAGGQSPKNRPLLASLPSKETLAISVAIPTYRRGAVLIETIRYIRALQSAPAEIIVLDQTESHESDVADILDDLVQNASIKLIRLSEPSIPKSMNIALKMAAFDTILFIDDDIVPDEGLVRMHSQAQVRITTGGGGILIAGRVLQPGYMEASGSDSGPFHFASTESAKIREFMGGNFSVDRREALAIGGFDENFVSVAYCFEKEFAYRWCAAGNQIIFEPRACIHHRVWMSGGTRAYGNNLTTVRPHHSVGYYYFHLRTWRGLSSAIAVLTRPFRSIATRFHLLNPWYIPGTFCSHIGGLIWALRLAMVGPNFARTEDPERDNSGGLD